MSWVQSNWTDCREFDFPERLRPQWEGTLGSEGISRFGVRFDRLQSNLKQRSRSPLQLCGDLTHADTPVDLIDPSRAVITCSVLTSHPWTCVLRETTSNAELNWAWNVELIAWLRADCNRPHWELMVDWTMYRPRTLNAADIILNWSSTPFRGWLLYPKSKETLVKARRRSLNEYRPDSS